MPLLKFRVSGAARTRTICEAATVHVVRGILCRRTNCGDESRATCSLFTSMIESRIEAIESTIERTPNISTERRAELLQLVAELKAEVARLAETHHEEASSISRFADASAHEVARSEKKPQLADTALQGLRQSIEGLEESHPVIVGIVNRFANALSNMGL